jgi:hypothetical protein
VLLTPVKKAPIIIAPICVAPTSFDQEKHLCFSFNQEHKNGLAGFSGGVKGKRSNLDTT